MSTSRLQSQSIRPDLDIDFRGVKQVDPQSADPDSNVVAWRATAANALCEVDIGEELRVGFNDVWLHYF